MADAPLSEKVAKLPMWAQRHIRDLERQRNEWRQQAEDKADPRANAFIKHGVTMPDEAIGEDPTIRFQLGLNGTGEGVPSWQRDHWIDVRHERLHDRVGNGLYITAARRLIVLPQASNVVKLENDHG